MRRYATVWFNSGSTADTRARELVQRYGLLAHMLLYKDARGQLGLEDAIGKGLLLPDEATILTSLPSRSQMVFTWLMDFWSRADPARRARSRLGGLYPPAPGPLPQPPSLLDLACAALLAACLEALLAPHAVRHIPPYKVGSARAA